MASRSLSKIKLIGNPAYRAHGTKSYAHLLRKYNIQPTMPGPFHHSGHHKRLMVTRADGTVGEVPAEDVQNDVSYTAEVGIGTPVQTFKLDFDTGSADLWLWSTDLSTTVQHGQPTHNLFNPTKSSTFKRMAHSTWKIQYGDSSGASGHPGTDNVVLGGLTIEGQVIELANKVSAQFQQDSSDGLLGLAFGAINTVKPVKAKTPVENLILQEDIPKEQELFTAYLGSYKDINDPDKGESFYTFGYIDQDTVQATGKQIQYTPIDSSDGFWMFDSTSASVNGKLVQLAGNRAIADTGTTLALVSDTLCKAIYQAIPGAKYDQSQQGYIFPASTTADQLPIVTVAVGDNQVTIQKEDLAFADAGNGMVFGGVQSRGNNPFDILGDTFLKAIYAIFDVGNMQFGYVERNDPTQSVGV